MAWGIAVIFVEFVLMIVLFPVKINVKAHASLDRKALQLNLSVLKIPIVRLRGNLSKEPYLQINGKKAKKKDKTIPISALKNAISYAKNQKLLKYSSVVALFALDDAKNSAIACAAMQMLPLGIKMFQSGKERFEADCALEMRISMVQILDIVRLVSEKDKDAKL